VEGARSARIILSSRFNRTRQPKSLLTPIKIKCHLGLPVYRFSPLMVLPSLFAKSSKKAKQPPIYPNLSPGSGATKSNPGTPPSSPDKKSHSKVKERERERRSGSYKRSSKYDRDSHPLNLPPDELRRLSSSAMSQMADQGTPQPMDIDREPTSPAPSSPVEPTPNGKTNSTNGDAPKPAAPSKPAPPPHRYTNSPPPPSAKYAATPEDASAPVEPPTINSEEYKAAGNKFFKIKDYPAAIKEYSKGAFFPPVLYL
jgi:DnaJ family protein C protein 7